MGGVLWLDLESTERRYLLTACSDASVHIYDTCAAPGQEGLPDLPPLGARAAPGEPPLLSISKSSPGAHQFSVSCAIWYPLDNGIFVTGSFDREVKVWNANAAVVAESFQLGSRVHCLAMSPIPGAHCLTAVGLEDPQIQLVDLVSGSTLQQLSGHTGPVWCLAWSPTNEWQLLSGGTDGAIRVWDIRRAGAALEMLDAEQTTAARAPAPSMAMNGTGGAGLQARSLNANRSRSAPSNTNGLQPQGLTAPDPTRHAMARGVRAHAGAVTGLGCTPDGLLWVSSGADDAARVWDGRSFANTLAAFPSAFNRARRPKRIAVGGPTARAVFLPSGSAALGYTLPGGAPLCTLRSGHFEAVNACLWDDATQQLYTGGADGAVLTWTADGTMPGSDSGSDWSD